MLCLPASVSQTVISPSVAHTTLRQYLPHTESRSLNSRQYLISQCRRITSLLGHSLEGKLPRCHFYSADPPLSSPVDCRCVCPSVGKALLLFSVLSRPTPNHTCSAVGHSALEFHSKEGSITSSG